MNKNIKQPSCAGIIVFDNSYTNVVIVRAHQTNYGFGKGGLNKNEKHIVGAFRENREETGLLPKDIEIIPNTHIDELSKLGIPSVRYYIGRLVNDIASYELKQEDCNEIDEVKWFSINDALKVLWDKRKNLLQSALNLIKTNTNFVNGQDALNLSS